MLLIFIKVESPRPREKSNVLSRGKIHATAKEFIYGIPLSIHTVHFFYAPPSNSYLYLWIVSGPQALRKV